MYQNFTRLCLLLFSAIILLMTACQKDEIATDSDVPANSARRSLGLLPATSAQLAALPTAAPPATMGTLPSSFFLRTPPPEQRGQGGQGSCVGWASAYSLMGFYMRQSGSSVVDYGTVGSPSYIYNQIKVSGCGDGAYCTDAFDLLRAQGVCTWQKMSYNDNDCSQQPTSTQRANAGLYRINSYSKIMDRSELSLKTILYSQEPIMIAMTVYSNFDNIGTNVLKTKSGSVRGGHALVIMGYDDARHAYKVLNSWGNSWGDNGYFWLDYDFAPQIINEAYLAEVTQQHNTSCDAPSNMHSSNVTANSCSIAWSGVQGATEYLLLWHNNQNQWQELWTTNNPSTGCSQLSPNSQYCFAVKARCGNGWSDQSSSVCVTTRSNQSCGTPTGLSLYNVTQNTCSVESNTVSGADYYTIYLYDGFNWNALDNNNSPYFQLNNLQPNTNYCVAVSATCNGVSGNLSSSQCFDTPNVQYTCDDISNIWASGVGSDWCRIRWQAVANADYYNVYWNNNGSYNYIGWTNNNTFYTDRLFANSQYCFAVMPICSNAAGHFSSEVCVTTTNYTSSSNNRMVVDNTPRLDLNKAAPLVDIHKRLPKQKPERDK